MFHVASYQHRRHPQALTATQVFPFFPRKPLLRWMRTFGLPKGPQASAFGGCWRHFSQKCRGSATSTFRVEHSGPTSVGVFFHRAGSASPAIGRKSGGEPSSWCAQECKLTLMRPALSKRFLAIGRIVRSGRVLNVFTGEARAFAAVGRNYKVAALMQASIVNANAVSVTG